MLLKVLAFGRDRPTLTAGTFLLLCLVLIAIFAPLLTPYDPISQSLMDRKIPPIWHAWFYDNPRAGWAHPLGTDSLGRDYWTRIIYGARISLVIGIGSALLCVAIGTTAGLLAGYFGGWLDLVVNFMIQTRIAVPIMLIGLVVVGSLGGSVGLMVLFFGLLLWDRTAAMVRTATQQIASSEFVDAARVLGYGDFKIIIREILPNLGASIFTMLSLEVGHVAMLEAGLSFLGVGIPPPSPSWGLMIGEAKAEIFFSPWTIVLPGIALLLLVLSTSLLAEGLRSKK